MKRIYISGPITGVKNFKELFDEAEKELKRKYINVEIINPTMIVLPQTCEHKDYMRIDFMLLDLADTIYMLKGWENSKGACMEYGYAIAKDKEIWQEGEKVAMLVDAADIIMREEDAKIKAMAKFAGEIETELEEARSAWETDNSTVAYPIVKTYAHAIHIVKKAKENYMQ